jgi:hypothetical protein
MGASFSASVQTGTGTHPASYTVGIGSFLGIKWPGRGANHLLPSSAEVLRRSSAIPLLPLWAFVAYSGVEFTFTFNSICTLRFDIKMESNFMLYGEKPAVFS